MKHLTRQNTITRYARSDAQTARARVRGVRCTMKNLAILIFFLIPVADAAEFKPYPDSKITVKE